MGKWTCGLVFAALVLGVLAPIGVGRDPRKDETPKPDPKKVKELMHRKLEASQKVLEALAVNDLAKASKNAEELIRIRKEVAWMAVKTEQYKLWSDEFTRSAQGIIKAAKDDNLESAKLNYLGMTLACFHCHTYVRDIGKINFEK